MFLRDVKAIGGELQQKLLKVVLDGRWIRKIQQSHTVKVFRPKVWKLLNDKVEAKFSEKMEVFYRKIDEQNAWLKCKTSALKAAEEVCGVSRGRPQHGETWWWNKDGQKTIYKRDGNNLHPGKINPVMSLIKWKPKELLLKQ